MVKRTHRKKLRASGVIKELIAYTALSHLPIMGSVINNGIDKLYTTLKGNGARRRGRH